jgi:hypothetical protein
MTAPDQCCISVKKLLSIRRRPHMTDAVEKLLDDLTKAFRSGILGVFLSRSALPFLAVLAS